MKCLPLRRVASVCALVIFGIPWLMVPALAEAQRKGVKPARAAETRRSAPAAPPQGLGLQAALDRAGFSPGEIDGQPGRQTQKALRAFQAARSLAATGVLNRATREALGPVLLEPVVTYTVSETDAQGPFIGPLTGDMMEHAKLPALGYQSLAEMLAERFHSNARLLERLNGRTPFEAGRTIRVPNVEALAPPSASGRRRKTEMAATPAMTITVNAAERTLIVSGEDGAVTFFAPVSVGSERDPLPTGEFTILSVHLNPVFYYNPALFWDADESHAKAKVAAGPNNPVGFVWLDLSQEHLGIHGTPEPSSVGSTQSHGCIRLTNWDALRLAAMVGDGTRVVLQ